jgi:CheY-like chemotaxis protein
MTHGVARGERTIKSARRLAESAGGGVVRREGADLIAEAGTDDVRPESLPATGRERESALLREAGTFLSTHLLRELVATDARSESAGETVAQRAEALLGQVLTGLDLTEGAIVLSEAAGAHCIATRGIPDHARELLEAREPHLDPLGPSLVKRALDERRVLLLDRTTREPLMAALRDGNPDVECAVVVPLHDRGVAVGVLLLAARGRRMSASFLRSLAVAFRLLGTLLAPTRGRVPAAPRADEPQPASADGERYLFEIEELHARLAEARASAQQMEERASSADAALRAEIEGSRARIAELEAQLAGVDPSRARELELESVCAEQSRLIAQQEQRVTDLEAEIAVLLERIAYPESHVQRDGEESWSAAAVDDAALDSVRDPSSDEAGEATETIELTERGDEALGEIAAAAAAALDDVIEDDDAPLDDDAAETMIGAPDESPLAADEPLAVVLEDDGGGVAAAADEAPADTADLALAVLHIDGRAAACDRARDAAADAGAAYWSGDGDPPHATTTLAVVNLLDEALVRFATAPPAVHAATRWIVYGALDDGTGFELGSCGLLHRPIDPKGCLAQMQRAAGRKPGGTLLVSAQLREVAGLRQALQEVDVVGSVACDARQALDLLEIVRRPDVVMIDLALPQGQGLALAAQLRRQRETASLPLVLLLPAVIEPARMRDEAERAQLLGPFADEDVHRLVRATLAGRG